MDKYSAWEGVQKDPLNMEDKRFEDSDQDETSIKRQKMIDEKNRVDHEQSWE